MPVIAFNCPLTTICNALCGCIVVHIDYFILSNSLLFCILHKYCQKILMLGTPLSPCAFSKKREFKADGFNHRKCVQLGHFNMAEIQQRTVLPELPDDIGARCCEEKILPYKTCSNGKTSFSFSFFFSLSLFFFEQIRAMLLF